MMSPDPTENISVQAADGYPIKGFAWRHAHEGAGGVPRPVVVVNAATSVRCRYYFRFAAYLHAHGFDVIAYDYRGIGVSRPATLRGFDASWSDWGMLDFEAILLHTAQAFPGQPVHVVAHSFGGCAAGLAASGHRIGRIVTVGAQFAYWKDYASASRLQLLLKWHLVMPLLALCWGYFPGEKLGWMEDTPRGVACDWSTPTASYEDRPSGKRAIASGPLPFAAVTAPILAIGLNDDPFGTVPAIERLLRYFTASPRTHLRIAPADIGVDQIGHFAFFHSRFERQLWPIALAWLVDGRLPENVPGTLLRV